MSEMPSSVGAGATDHHRLDVVKEAATMGLYVSICLLAALAVAGEAAFDHRTNAVAVIWGTTLGLALAHWFAFRVSARLVSGGTVSGADAELALAQLAGSAVVAVLATVPVLLVNGVDAQYQAASWVVTAVIAAVGFLVARGGGASIPRAALYATVITLVAFAVVLIKNVLGH